MLPQNRTIFTADNLPVMRGIDSDSIDLIYLDPPFNSNRNYAAPIGSEAAGAFFEDIWTFKDTDNEWHGAISDLYPNLYEAIRASEHTYGPSMKSYLIAMSVRLIEMKRILKPTGSIYYHCDPKASHYIKIIIDAVLGAGNFRNEIIWHYHMGTSPRKDFRRKHDIIFRYSKSEKYQGVSIKVQSRMDAKRYNKIDEDGRKYHENGAGKRFYQDQGRTPDDVWTYCADKSFTQLNSMSKERTGYPTQKPLKLLQRIIKASSNEGDLVLDPFCGCATTCVAAEDLGRQWIGIDMSELAFDLVQSRLRKLYGQATIDNPNYFGEINHIKEIPHPVSDSSYYDMLSSDEVPLVEIEPFLGFKTNEEIEEQKEHYRNKNRYKYELYGEQNGCCNGCTIALPMRNLEIDHIKSRRAGGGHEKENLQLLCSHCNSVKSDGPHDALIKKLKERNII